MLDTVLVVAGSVEYEAREARQGPVSPAAEALIEVAVPPGTGQASHSASIAARIAGVIRDPRLWSQSADRTSSTSCSSV